MVMILCLLHLIISTSQIDQKSHEYKKIDRKERQFGILAVGLTELVSSVLGSAAVGTAAAAGTAGVIAGAVAIKDSLDHHHHSDSGSSSGGGQAITQTDLIKTEMQTMLATAKRPGSKYKTFMRNIF